MRKGILLIILVLFAFKDVNALCKGWTLEIDELHAEQIWIKWTNYSDLKEHKQATFTVEFKEFNKDWVVLESGIRTKWNTRVTSFLKGGLKPSTEYSLRVRRKCDGVSGLSKKVTFTTRSKNNPPTTVCRGIWLGKFVSYHESHNSIFIEWSDGGNSAFYTVWYSKSLSGNWKALNPTTNLKATIPNLEDGQSYQVRVVRSCPENTGNGLHDSNRYIRKNFNTTRREVGYCSGIWMGVLSFQYGDGSIKLYWDSHIEGARFTVRRRYISGGDSDKPHPKNWVPVATNISGGGVTVRDLEPLVQYEIEVTQSCKGEVKKVDTDKYTVPRNVVRQCSTVRGLSTINITHNSARIDGTFPIYDPLLFGQYSDYDIQLWESNDPTRKRIIDRKLISLYDRNGDNTRVLKHRVIGADSEAKDPPLKPDTDYSYYVVHHCMGRYGDWPDLAPPGVMNFRTSPAPTGACGCTIGNKTVPDATNSAATHFYCGNVVGAATIAESSGTTTFRGATVELNPGFETHMSGTGSFVAVAFDPNTCQESAAAPPQGQASASAAQMSAYDNSSSNAKVLVPKKYIVYPNPNRGSFSIDFKEKDAIIKSIAVYDMFGVRILHKRYNRRLDVEQYSLRLVKSGLYKIAIRTANGVEYETLLVEF